MDEKQILAKKEKQMKSFMWFFIALIGMTVYLSFIIAQDKRTEFYLGFVLVIPFGILSFYFRSKMMKYRALYYIKDSWGKVNTRKRNLNDIKKLYEFLKSENKEVFYIDNQTFEDFTMDKVFEKLDRTLSGPGEQVLYNMLRTPQFNEEELSRRKKFINLFQKDKNLRERVQMELYWLSRQNHNSITDFLWGILPKKSKKSILFNTMALLPVIILVLMPFYGLGIGIYIIFVFIINMFIHYKFKKEISMHIDSITYLSSVINTARRLGEIDNELLADYKTILKDNVKDIKAAKAAAVIGSVEGSDPMGAGAILDYINILFLTKERKFFSVLDEVSKYRDALRKLYIALGEIDSFISIASYREGLDYYTEPELDNEGKHIEVKDLVHPLIDEPVPNSINIKNKGIILTGSNMSGKSTFLRTIGVNALFAQTICTCLAKEYKSSCFKILSSISPSDNLLTGKSYYLGEAEAVLRIIKSCEEAIPSLCIIDEIFRGTNPIERISASAEILDFLISHNSLPIVATHDLELTEIVDKSYECYYFTENVGEEGLNFDYLIRKGVSPTRNAIKLLKYLGYPEEIIYKTYKRVDNLFVK
ncbi:MutS family DNA mismatch repair protein [Clostridium sp. SYSU_GA19001]|uniref:MutS-related protein n=1 Tax=Clostridium caldaquaticum TaxID=2940653 RepID=UPI002076EE3C|nr:MutS family DNA mismatch repair protein [Clostridium caldaquaticum]MCM8709773.1 MutS family DNA mismatch repair protein [Clostridium caldaquaticum]